MKTVRLFAIGMLGMSLVACAQNDKTNQTEKPETVEVTIPKKNEDIGMNKDSLDLKVIAEVEKEMIKRKAELTAKALSTIGTTQMLLKEIVDGKKDEAIKRGKELIGDLEVLLEKNPELALLPVDVTFQKEELVTDIETVKDVVKQAEKAMDKGYYRVASDLLKDMRSEMVINTFLIPTVTYPEAIKAAVILLEEGKEDDAKIVLAQVLSSVVIEKTVEPLPVLNAEQMIIESALIDAKNHENVDTVLKLLNGAEYQLQLAEAMGYGKKDKEYKVLSKVIKTLKKSVENKENSESKFDDLKDKLKAFRSRLFSNKK